MAIKRYSAQRFSGLASDVNSLPIDADLIGAIFNSTDTLEFWIFDDTLAWNKSVTEDPTDPSFDTITLTNQSTPIDPPAGQGRLWVETIDVDNDGVFAKIKVDGTFKVVRVI